LQGNPAFSFRPMLHGDLRCRQQLYRKRIWDNSAQSRVEWLAAKEGLQCSQERHPLLAHRGQVATDPGERFGTAVRSERASNLLLDLEHAQVLLGLVVVEGDGEVVQEGQHRVLAYPQAIEQAAWGRLLQTSALAWLCQSPGYSAQ